MTLVLQQIIRVSGLNIGDLGPSSKTNVVCGGLTMHDVRGGGGRASGARRARMVNGNEDEGRLGLTPRRWEGTRTLTRRRPLSAAAARSTAEWEIII